MVFLAAIITLFLYGCYQAYRSYFPKKEKPYVPFTPPVYSQVALQALERAKEQERIEAEEKRRRKRSYSPAKEIARLTILRQHGILSESEYLRLKNDVIYNAGL